MDRMYIQPVLTCVQWKYLLNPSENFITYVSPLDKYNAHFYHFQIVTSTLFFRHFIEVPHSECYFHNTFRIALHNSLSCSPCYTISRDVVCSAQNSIIHKIVGQVSIFYRFSKPSTYLIWCEHHSHIRFYPWENLMSSKMKKNHLLRT